MANEKGFTLVEILVVLVIISIVSAIGYPSFANISQRAEFKAEVSNLVGQLQRARFEAIKTHSYVVVQASLNGYKIFLDNSRTKGQAGDWTQQADEKSLANCQLPQDLTLSSNFPDNKFRFKGTTGVKAGNFTLTDSNGKGMSVIINTTGRIRVE